VTGLIVLAHAVLGIVFFGGLFGRWIVLGLAAKAETLAAMRTLTKAAAPFEWIVIVIGTIGGLLGIASAISQGRPLFGPLQGAPVDWLFASIVLVLSAAPLPRFVFIPRGKVFEAALAEATARDQVTPELMAAWHDPVTRAAHGYELFVTSTVLVLMLAKPF